MADDNDLTMQDELSMHRKKSPFTAIVITMALIASFAGGGYFAYLQFFPVRSSEVSSVPVDKPASAQVREEAELNVMFPVRPFVVNLARSGGKRFLKVTLTMELNSPEVNAEVNENMSKIVDSILLLLSSKSFEDIYTVQGKFKLKDEITTRVNRFLVSGHVKDVYFTEFVIQ